MFFIIGRSEKQLLISHKILWISYKAEAGKITNLLNDWSNKESKFATTNDSQTAEDKYNQNNSIKLSLCDYSDAFVLVTWDIIVTADNDIDVAFRKNCAHFSTQKTEIDGMFIDEANHIYIAMPMYNLIE